MNDSTPDPYYMNDATPDGGIRPSRYRSDIRSTPEQLRERIAQLAREVDRLQMENAELRYERDAARLARVIPESDGYSDGEVWAS